MEIIGSVKWLQMVEGDGVENGGKWWRMVDSGGAWWQMVKNGGEWWRLVDIAVESGGNAMER